MGREEGEGGGKLSAGKAMKGGREERGGTSGEVEIECERAVESSRRGLARGCAHSGASVRGHARRAGGLRGELKGDDWRRMEERKHEERENRGEKKSRGEKIEGSE